MKTAKSLLVLMLMLGLAVITSCKNSASDRPLIVGVLIGPEYADQADIIVRAAQAAADTDGRGVIVTEKISQATTQAYHQSFTELKSRKMDEETVMGLVMTGNPAIDMQEDIRSASLSGKPVVVFGQDYASSHRDLFVKTDDGMAGKLLADQLDRAQAPGSKIIAVITGSAENEKQLRTITGLRNELAQYARISVLKTITYENDSQTAGEVKALLERTPNLFAIVATGPWLFQPEVKNALSGYRGRLYAVANTREAFDALQSGKAEALVVEDVYQQAYLAARYCLMRLRTIPVRQSEALKPVLVTRDNVTEILDKWGEKPLTDSTNTSF